MKKIALILFALPLLFSSTSCIKDEGCQDKTVASETGAMTAYATTNNITATTHPSGMLYQITNPGTGTQATANSTVSIRYVGKLLDGTVFDSQTGTPVSFQVAGTVPGFQLALQLLREGGTVKVIIPSSLAYGCTGNGSIPGGSILYFEIELVDVV